MSSIIIVLPKLEDAKHIKDILARRGLTAAALCTTASMALAQVHQLDSGVVICTTGIGMCVTANKIRGIRCALLSDLMSARLTREHNDSNMMALGQGVVGEKLALEIVDVFLSTPFSGAERHVRRIGKLSAVEAE